jgi:hypothetical protein
MVNQGRCSSDRPLTGERRIDPTELEKFAKLYGKPVTFFLGG